MPSQSLSDLSKQIETQETDSFGKFYLYANLLKHISNATGRNQAFFDSMPKYTAIIPAKLNVGKTGADFNPKIANYKSEFDVKVPNFFLVIQRILLSFVRKGQLSDLVFILDRMNDHLNAAPMAEGNYNGSIYTGASFEKRKVGLQNLLGETRRVARLAQDGIDNAMYGVITIIAAIAAIKMTMFLGGVLFTLLMLVSAGLAAFHFFHVSEVSLQNIGESLDACLKTSRDLAQEHVDKIYAPNNLSFIINGVLAPIAYTMIKVRELCAVDSRDLQIFQSERTKLDTEFTTLNSMRY